MKRLGYLTGTIYPYKIDKSEVKECTRVITDEQAEDRDYIDELNYKDIHTCMLCRGCPHSWDCLDIPYNKSIRYEDYFGIAVG